MEPIRTIQIFQKPPSPRTFLAGEVIFRSGEPGELVYGIIKGQVEILVKEKVIETINAGDVFGQSAVVQPEHTRASTAIAKTDCFIAFLDREHFLFALEETPMFAMEILRSYSNRLRHSKHLIAEMLPNS